MSKKALVVVDVQTGLFENPQSDLYQPDDLLKNINNLIEKARDAELQIIFIRHNDQVLLLQSSAWEIHKDLKQLEGDLYIDKQHCDSFLETDFKEILEKYSIDEIVVCGLQTEYCVDTVCRSAVSRKIKTTLVKDAHSTYDSDILKAKLIIDHHNSSLGAAFVDLVETAALKF